MNHFNNTKMHYSHSNTSEFCFFLASHLAFLKQETLVQNYITGYTNPEGNCSFNSCQYFLLNTYLCICRKCITALDLKPLAALLLIFLDRDWCWINANTCPLLCEYNPAGTVLRSDSNPSTGQQTAGYSVSSTLGYIQGIPVMHRSSGPPQVKPGPNAGKQSVILSIPASMAWSGSPSSLWRTTAEHSLMPQKH